MEHTYDVTVHSPRSLATKIVRIGREKAREEKQQRHKEFCHMLDELAGAPVDVADGADYLEFSIDGVSVRLERAGSGGDYRLAVRQKCACGEWEEKASTVTPSHPRAMAEIYRIVHSTDRVACARCGEGDVTTTGDLNV